MGVRWLWGAAGTVGLGLAPTAHAQDLILDIDEEKARAFGIDVAPMEQQLEAEAAEALNFAAPEDFMDSMARATGVASKGMGVDYASNMKAFVLGVGFGPSTHGSGLRFQRPSDEYLPEDGFAFMVTAMAGVNLGVLDGGLDTVLDRVRIYVNGMSLTMPADREFGGHMYNIGVHAQVQLVPDTGNALARWGGLALTSGWEKSQYRLELENEAPINAPLDGGVRVKWTADGTYTVTSDTSSVPIELSTNVKLAVVTVFAGGAVDINTSTATSEASLSGPVDGTYEGTTERLGTAGLDMGFDGEGDRVVPRGFGGVQFNVALLRIYGHVNLAANGALGGHAGVRVAM